MTSRFTQLGAALLMTALLAGCGSSSSDSQASSSVAITTTRATRQTFHDGVAAWGTVRADSSHLQHLSMAHGGLVSALPVSAGQAVHAGQVLLRMTTDPAALDAYRRAQNALVKASKQARITMQLFHENLATQSQVDSAQQAQADAEAAMQAQQALDAGQAQRSLRAPSDGVVTMIHVGRGDRVAANARLLDFAPGHGRVARLGVQPDRADAIRAGMPVQVQAVYDNQDHGTGKVDMVGHAIDPADGLVPVRVQLPAGLAAKLPDGSPVKGSIQTRRITAWAVPRAAVLDDAKGSYLFQEDHGHAKRVDVKVLQPHGDTLGVSGALDARLPVIVMGAYELSDGDAVRKAGP